MNSEPLRPTQSRPLTMKWALAIAFASVAAFHLGFLFSGLYWLVLVYLGGLFTLRRVGCGRAAFYTGLGIGLGIYGPQLHFFWNIFGPAAVPLWLVLAFWIGFFVLVVHGVEKYWGTGWAVLLAPVLWLGLEFFRSELYYLRFAWFTAGSFLPPDEWTWGFANLGVYGLGAALVLGAAVPIGFAERWATGYRPSRRLVGGMVLGMVVAACLLALPRLTNLGRAKVKSGPNWRLRVAGIQLEFPHVSEVMAQLDRVIREHPETDLVMLGEYTFDGPVPQEIRDWCRQNKRYLVAGGKEPLPNGRFHNTAYVVSPDGEIAFKQAKAVPIQFFDDGLPAGKQHLWQPSRMETFDPDPMRSMPARIGFCICYDLNYALVVHRIIQRGDGEVPLLLVLALDVIDWGEHAHRLNARMTPIRAAEHRIWIFRVATSGISQLVSPNGQILAQAGYPGQGELLTADVRGVYHSNSQPWDRVLGFLAAPAVGLIIVLLGIWRWRLRTHLKAVPPPTN